MNDDRAAELRRSFDDAFAVRTAEVEPAVDLLAVTVGRDALALRVNEILSIHRVGRIRALPGAPSELVGLAGIRGRVVPVYDLAAIVSGAPQGTHRWLVLVGSPVLGLAFEALDRHERVVERDIVASASGERYVRDVATLNGAARAILDLKAVWQEVRSRASRSGGR